MFGYALVSCIGNDASLWCDLQAAFVHITKVEKLAKLNSKSGGVILNSIRESEMAARNEWARAGQVHPETSLSEIIAVISHRRVIWPGVTEFGTVKREIEEGPDHVCAPPLRSISPCSTRPIITYLYHKG